MASIGFDTRANMILDVGRGMSHSNGTTFDAAVAYALNTAYAEVLRMHPWQLLVRQDETGLRKGDDTTLFTFESGDVFAPMPPDIDQIISVEIFSPTYRRLQIVTPTMLAQRMQNRVTEIAPPEYAAFVGTTAQYKRMAATGTPTVRCNVATNDNVQTPRVYYQHTAGQTTEVVWEEVSGTFNVGDGVPLSAAVPAGWPIKAIEIPAGWVGRLAIYDDAATPVRIAQVFPIVMPTTATDSNERLYFRQLMRTYPATDADAKAIITYKYLPQKMTEAQDRPAIPVSEALVEMAIASMLRRDRKAKLAIHHEAIAERILGRIMRGQQHTQMEATPSHGSVLSQTGFDQS
jgi:hypothetical protein